MYLETLRIKHLKLIRDIELDFRGADGEVRRWTVLIGKNGRGKTTILQAIALAAAGSYHANDLGKSLAPSFRPQRAGEVNEETRIEARFALEPLAPTSRHAKARVRELWPEVRQHKDDEEVHLESTVRLRPGYFNFECSSRFERSSSLALPGEGNPLTDARARGLPYWFVVAYGMSRYLSASDGPTQPPHATELHLERLRSMFDPAAQLRAIRFADALEDSQSRLLARFLQALVKAEANLFPELSEFELRGQGGAKSAEDLLNRHRIMQSLPNGEELKLPASWLSHGYQASLAWMADLIGHWLIEDEVMQRARTPRPEDLRGLVLIDELDMYLHPTWQTRIVHALAETFPNLQFIVTTHSPLILSALRPEEVVRLELDDDAQIVAHHDFKRDPRLMTGSELQQEFFELGSLYSQELGRIREEYIFWAPNPHRSDAIEKQLDDWEETLCEEGLLPDVERVERAS